MLPSQAKPSQAKPSQAKPSQAKPSQAKPSPDLSDTAGANTEAIYTFDGGGLRAAGFRLVRQNVDDFAFGFLRRDFDFAFVFFAAV
ncbi:putative type III restriction-modification system methyltransferase domain protein [Neisseria meningitidis 2002038]|nr:putative type III restriction-modification system methyltransferase domain protein [Neisseria meningitidis 2002038]